VVISAIARERYESERPSAAVARRDGDERFLARRESIVGTLTPDGDKTP
jgi:hypothetical protein